MTEPDPWSDVYVVVRDNRTGAVVKCWQVWAYMRAYWQRCARMVFPDESRYAINWQTEECANYTRP